MYIAETHSPPSNYVREEVAVLRQTKVHVRFDVSKKQRHPLRRARDTKFCREDTNIKKTSICASQHEKTEEVNRYLTFNVLQPYVSVWNA